MRMRHRALLSVNDLEVSFSTRAGQVRAVRGVSFEIEAGEALALVGESGCGKSATARAIMRLNPCPPAQVRGGICLGETDLMALSERQMQSVRGREMGMIFQDPMTALDPTMPIGRQIAEGMVKHLKIPRGEAKARAVELLRRVQLPDPERRAGQYPFELSGGMCQRVVIAMAMACAPRLLIADEPTTALDVTIQHQILKQMRSLQEEYGTSIIFITHDLGVVAELCDRVVVLYGGLVMEEAEINDLFENPLHPYTMGLLASIPGLTKDKSERLQSIPGSPPDMTKPPKGCPFASRCQFARNICAAECPPFVQVGSRQARCWLLQPDAPAEGNPLHEKLAEAERKAH